MKIEYLNHNIAFYQHLSIQNLTTENCTKLEFPKLNPTLTKAVQRERETEKERERGGEGTRAGNKTHGSFQLSTLLCPEFSMFASFPE